MDLSGKGRWRTAAQMLLPLPVLSFCLPYCLDIPRETTRRKRFNLLLYYSKQKINRHILRPLLANGLEKPFSACFLYFVFYPTKSNVGTKSCKERPHLMKRDMLAKERLSLKMNWIRLSQQRKPFPEKLLYIL